MNHTIAVVGCGRISCSHIPALASLDNVTIKYLCDLIPEKAEEKRQRFNLPESTRIITDYNIALNDPEVEAVWVLTPNFAHYTVTMDALRAGKHVMCEKPITVNYKLSCEMADEANKQGKILNIGVCNRFHRSVELLEEMVREGKFGKLYHVVCSFRAFRSIPGLGGDFTTKAVAGGGALIDWGVHYLDLILYILGGARLKTITCDTYSEMAKDMKAYKYHGMWAEDTKNVETGTNDVDDFVTGHIRTDKASISVNGAWAQNVAQGDCWIDFLGDKGGARLIYGGQFTFTDGSTLESYTTSHEIPNMYLGEDRDFLRCIEVGEKNRNNIDNILETMKLLDTMYQSAEIKKEIELA